MLNTVQSQKLPAIGLIWQHPTRDLFILWPLFIFGFRQNSLMYEEDVDFIPIGAASLADGPSSHQ